MGYYDKDELERLALEAIEKQKLFFLDDVCAMLPCAKSTFYALQLEKSEAIKAALNKQKVAVKVGIRRKLYQDGSAAGLIALYKLVGTEDEIRRLSNSQQTINNNNVITRDFEGLLRAASRAQAPQDTNYTDVTDDSKLLDK